MAAHLAGSFIVMVDSVSRFLLEDHAGGPQSDRGTLLQIGVSDGGSLTLLITGCVLGFVPYTFCRMVPWGCLQVEMVPVPAVCISTDHAQMQRTAESAGGSRADDFNYSRVSEEDSVCRSIGTQNLATSCLPAQSGPALAIPRSFSCTCRD